MVAVILPRWRTMPKAIIKTPRNYKDTHRNKPENYFLGWLTIMGVLLIEVAY
jgi:hypothetical protein